MAENDNDLQDDGQNDNNSGKGLRAQLEAALAKNAALEQSVKELSQQTRSTNLAKFLESAGARKGAEDLYPESADVSEEAVKAWVEKNAAFVRDEVANDDTQTQVSEQTRVNTQRLAALADTAGGKQTLGDPASIAQQIKDAKTPEELQAVYAQIGFQRT